MRTWLNGFAYHIEIEFSMFLFSGFTVLLIALITVTYQSLRAAKVNPADVLRNE
jgi:putative ABC transport system permease protein